MMVVAVVSCGDSGGGGCGSGVGVSGCGGDSGGGGDNGGGVSGDVGASGGGGGLEKVTKNFYFWTKIFLILRCFSIKRKP